MDKDKSYVLTNSLADTRISKYIIERETESNIYKTFEIHGHISWRQKD
jgi:hypothetical protein